MRKIILKIQVASNSEVNICQNIGKDNYCLRIGLFLLDNKTFSIDCLFKFYLSQDNFISTRYKLNIIETILRKDLKLSNACKLS